MSGFGGGLKQIGARIAVFQPNLCRDLVEVPGGSDWTIRRMAEEEPEFCWKLAENSVIVYFQLNLLKETQKIDKIVDATFYAKVTHFVSPVEISLLPKYLTTAWKNLSNSLNVFYNFQQINQLSDLQVFAGVVCAVKEAGSWFRGRVVQVSGRTHVVAELLDVGTRILAERRHLKPLRRRFGRVPPLVLRCRAQGVSINDLETKDLVAFKRVIDDCNGLVRVDLLSTSEPYSVNIYHPTISAKNICEPFFPPIEDAGKQARLDRNWTQHNEDFDEDEEVPDEAFSTNERSEGHVRYVQSLPRAAKASRHDDDVAFVGHVDSTSIVHLHYPWQVEQRKRIEARLCDLWDRMIRPPAQLLVVGQVCAIKSADRSTLVPRRAILTEIDPISENATLLLVDYGTHEVLRDVLKGDMLRLLPAEPPLTEPPTLSVVSLTTFRDAHMGHPHFSETAELQQLIPQGTRVTFRGDRNSKTLPFKGRLSTNDVNDIAKELQKRLSQKRIDVRCRALLPYSANTRTTQDVLLTSHVYRSTCHPSYVKGRLEVGCFDFQLDSPAINSTIS